MKVTIIIPVFNEENAIASVLEEIKNIHLPEKPEIIVVDDGSTDKTAEVLKNLSNEVRVISHEKNIGYGAALKTGIRHAENDIVVITDADKTYPNYEIPKLVKEIKDYDMVVGARTGENVQVPLIRRPAKWVLNKLANYLTDRKIPDLNSGLRVMRKEVVESYFNILSDGFSFTTTTTLAMLTNNKKVKYIPIDYYKREGRSKFHPIKDTLNFLKLILRTVLYFDPLKVFLPASFIFMGAGFILFLYRIFISISFGMTAMLLFVCGIQLLAIGMLADLIDKRLK